MPVTPIEKLATGLTRPQRLQRKISEFLFNDPDLAHVIFTCSFTTTKKVLAVLIAVDQALQSALRRRHTLSNRFVVGLR